MSPSCVYKKFENMVSLSCADNLGTDSEEVSTAPYYHSKSCYLKLVQILRLLLLAVHFPFHFTAI